MVGLNTLWHKITGDRNTGQQLIINNSLWLLLEKVMLMGGGLLLSMISARFLGAEGFGRYNYVLSFVALFAPVFSLGMLNVILRELSRQPQNGASILRTCVQARLGAGVVVGGMTLLTLFWWGEQWKFEAISVLLLCHVSNAYEVYERWFQHKSINSVVVKWRLSCFILFMALKLILLWYRPDFQLLLLLVATELFIKNIGYYFLYRHYPTYISESEFDWGIFKHIFSQSKFLIFSSLASVIYLKVDILMLEAMRPIEEVGIYSVAAKISEAWYVLPQVIIIAMFPKLLEIAQQSPLRYDRLLQRGFDLLFLSALVLSVVMFFASPWLIDLLFGQTYELSGQILRLHIFASVFIYMRVLLSQWLVTKSFAQFSLFSQLSGAVVNIALNWWLIPEHGPWGAAVATVISYGVSTYFCLWLFKRTRPVALMMSKAMLSPLRLTRLIKG